MALKIGDKVVCIKSFNNIEWQGGEKDNLPNIRPIKDEIYKVSENRGRYIVVEEIVGGVGWDVNSFRKVEPTKKKSNKFTKELLEKFKESERELIEYDPKEINIPVTNTKQ